MKFVIRHGMQKGGVEGRSGGGGAKCLSKTNHDGILF